MRLKHRNALLALCTIVLSGVVSLVAAEAVLRLIRDPNGYFPYYPNTVQVFFPSEAVTPGVTGPSYFTTNAYGTRGAELGEERIRILTVGGSTTACTVLDDSETWAHVLMESLNQRAGEQRVWVTNSGIDGKSSQHHLMHAIYLIPRLPQLDLAIYYVGLNDVGMWLYQEQFDPHFLDRRENWDARIAESFRLSAYTPPDWPIYKRLELWKRTSLLKARVSSALVQGERGDQGIRQDAELRWLVEQQARRQEREKLFVHRAKMDTLPDALDSYERTLEAIVVNTRRAGARPVFVAQAMQHLFLSEDERRRLWMGAMDGGKTYVKEEQMLELLKKHNDRLREVAQRLDVPYVDMPALLRMERNLFYDGHHFNEAGARTMGRVLARELVDRGIVNLAR